MRNFRLDPDSASWREKDYFLSGKDLNDCVEYYDEKYIPWIHHFVLCERQVYIKKSRKVYKVITNNFKSDVVPMRICSGYCDFISPTIENAFSIFRIIVKEILDLPYKNYEVPF